MDELLLLVYACVLGLVAFVPATARRALINGLLPLTKYGTGTRELNVSNRVRAVHKNLTAENLTPFIGIALSAHGLGVVGLAGPAALFCCGRLVHFFGAIFNPPFARTLGFVAGWAACMYVAYLVYGAYSALEAPSEGEKTFALITATCVFTLLLFVPYDLGRIPANGILKLTYYNDIVESDWLVRGKAAHLNMAKENLPPFVGIFLVAARLQSFDELAVQGAPQLALYFLAARCFHYLAAYVNIPFARTVGFVAGWAVCMCCAYLVALELLNMDNVDAGWLNLEMLSAISVFTLLLFIPYGLGRIPANGILKLTYYNKEMVESDWIQRAKAAHLHMAGLVLAADSLRVQEDLHLPYILGFRAAHYFVVWCNPPLLRTAFFAAAWMLMLRIAYLTIQAAGEDATMQSLVGAGIIAAATACTFVDNSIAPDGGSPEETQEKLEEKLLSLF